MRKWGLIVAVAAIAVVAVSGPAHSKMGVGVRWGNDAGLVPDMILPIKMASGMIIEPELGFASEQGTTTTQLNAASTGKPRQTQIRFGVGVEKAMKPEGTSAVWGGRVYGVMNSYSNMNLKSNFNFSIGVYIGGSAKLADGVDMIGTWGPTVQILGKVKSDTSPEVVLADSRTNFGSEAHLTFRFWVWGD